MVQGINNSKYDKHMSERVNMRKMVVILDVSGLP